MAETLIKQQGMDPTTRLASKTITGTRDLAAASGDVAYTGVGFRPTSIVVFAGITAAVPYSSGGAGSGRSGYSMVRAFDGNTYANLYADAVIVIAQATGSKDQWAKVASYDADGFTLTWTKVNLPTGSAALSFLCFR